MSKQHYKYNHILKLICLACACFISVFIFHQLNTQANSPRNVTKKIQENFVEFENELYNEFELLKNIVKDNCNSCYTELSKSIASRTLQGNIIILENDSIVFYSSNKLTFQPIFNNENKIIELPNGIYFQISENIATRTLKYFGLIQNKYPLKNQYLNSTYNKKLGIPANYRITLNHNDLKINLLDNNYAFSLQRTEYYTESTIWGVSILSLFGFIFLLIATSKLIGTLRINNIAKMLVALTLLIAIFLLTKLCLPVHNIEIYNPLFFASSAHIKSTASLLVACISFFTFCIFTYNCFDGKKYNNIIFFVALSSIVILLYVFIDFAIGNFVENSNFSLHLNKVNDISINTIIIYSCVGILYLGVFVIQTQLINVFAFKNKFFYTINLSLIALSLAIGFIVQWNNITLATILYLICNIVILYFSEIKLSRISLFYSIGFVTIFAFFTLINFQKHIDNNMKKICELFALIKKESHDAELEIYLKDIHQLIITDSIIPDKLIEGNLQYIEDYTKHKYFSNISSKYNIWLSLCAPEDEILIEPEKTLRQCYNFFDNMLSESGTNILGTNFYYIDKPSGLLSYFGKFTFSEEIEYTLFIQLEAKMLEVGLGFPQLLINDSQQEPHKYNDLSFAKYHNGKLVTVSGHYRYSHTDYDYKNLLTGTVTSYKSNDYNHTVLQYDNNDYIVVSSKIQSVAQKLFSYTYIYLLYLFFCAIFILIKNIRSRKKIITTGLSSKIQFAIVSAVFFSLLAASATTIIYNLNVFKSSYRTDLNQKTASISQELNFYFLKHSNINISDIDELWGYLGNLSNIFRTDINIYNTNGQLITSSRPGIYDLGLCSTFINPEAYYLLNNKNLTNVVCKESIGELEFLSAYEPIYNIHGETICYINLPYFMRIDTLQQDIINFIVAFINLSVFLLLLSVIGAFALSNRITKPLWNITEGLRDISISKQNKPLIYNNNDEIGKLVFEYNNKLKELEESAQLLAQSQREMAWKEMARQIAHEIKNPLTPMKLQIQHLQRAKTSSDLDKYNDIFNKVTSTLIEQIDRLNGIASSFSQFAKMPESNPELTNISKLIDSTINLFASNKNTIINYKKTNDDLYCYIDKEQLSRVMINLIKNAKQSVSINKVAHIDISLERDANNIVIAINDNGCGISDPIRNRLFEPNFTTKSSGMGLGLAISKQLVENAKGKIWFESNKNNGSSFFVKLPLSHNLE